MLYVNKFKPSPPRMTQDAAESERKRDSGLVARLPNLQEYRYPPTAKKRASVD